MKDRDFETAQWGFTWESARNDVGAPQGAVSLSRDGLILDIPFGLLLGGGFSSFDTDSPRPVEAEWVYGFSRAGDYLALSKAVIRSMTSSAPGCDSQRIGGDILLTSKARFNPGNKIECMAVAMTGLKEWIGESPFRVKRDGSTFAFKALEYDSENESSYNKTLYSCDDLAISVYHRFTATPLTVDGMSITHDCRLKFDFAKPRSIEGAMECVESFSRFLSLCLGFHAEIQSISFFSEGAKNPVELFGAFVRGAKPTKNEIMEIPVRFKSLKKKKVSKAIGAWLNAENEFDTACRMIASLTAGGWDMPIDLRFLAASQALEALGRVEAELESLPQDVYQSHRETVLESITNPETKSWIRDRMPGNTKGQVRLLKELLERHSGISDWLIPNRKAFIAAHTTTRNIYTHRSEGNSSKSKHLLGEDLHWHTEAVVVLCQGIIWSNLGINWKRFTELMAESRYKSHVIDEAREMYRVKNKA